MTAALAAYTREAAFLIHQESQRGQLAPGFAADIVVLDTDVTAGAPADINAAKVLFTIKDGVVVFKPDLKPGS